MPDSNSRRTATDSRLHLLMPQLLDVGLALRESLRLMPMSLPGLERLLARGTVRAPGPHLPGLSPGVAEAPLALMGEGRSPGEAYWLRADPVHLYPDQDHLLLWDAAALALSAEEAEALVASFNGHFAADGYALEALRPEAWYLRLERPLAAETTPVTEVSGRNAFHYLPTGPDKAPLEQLINETQMLFHDHPVNQARRRRGELPVSGLWPWGGGRLTRPEGGFDFDRVFSDNSLFAGLGHWRGRPVAPLPAAFDAAGSGRPAGRELVVIEQGSHPARMGDDMAWREALQQLDRDWWQPLARALIRGQLRELVLDFGQAGRVSLNPWGMRRLWRRPRSLWRFLNRGETAS